MRPMQRRSLVRERQSPEWRWTEKPDGWWGAKSQERAWLSAIGKVHTRLSISSGQAIREENSVLTERVEVDGSMDGR